MTFLELTVEVKAHAIALGNPPAPPQYTTRACVDQKIMSHGCSIDPGYRASTLFLIDSNSTIYDSGFYVLITYYLNSVIPDCEENMLINFEDSPMREEFFETKILPQLSIDTFITKVVIATQTDGTVAVCPDNSATLDCLGFSFPPGFTHEEVPAIPLSHLRRLPGMCLYDIVVRQDVSDSMLYVLKKEMEITILTTHVDHQSGVLLEEAMFLARLDSPLILRPSSLVIDANGRFRGYLLPFQPAGSLANVLSRVSERDVPVVQPYASPLEGGSHKFMQPRAQLDWKLKNAWALDIATGIAYLHKQNNIWGDVKLDNIVLSPDGRCRLIDCAPIMGISDPYAAPELEDFFHNPFGRLTPTRDVFALGLVLWALAEETPRFQRAVEFVAPRLSWTMGDDFAPVWYQELVNQCVAAEPDKRPTITHVLNALDCSGSL